jgi:hypothetical protein
MNVLGHCLIGLSSIISANVVAAQVSVNVLSNTEQPLADIVVYLLPLEQQELVQNKTPLIISQQGQAFAPYISVGQKGADIEFRNDDPITHHIYSITKGNKFNLIVKSNEHVMHKLAADGEDESAIIMGCNVHDWMGGVYLSVNTPYYAKTDKAGVASFNVDVLGKYAVTAWHPQIQDANNRLVTQLDVADDNASVSLKLTKKMAEIPSQSNEGGFDYLSSN